MPKDGAEPIAALQLLEDLVDLALPALPPYEFSIYLLLLRRSYLDKGGPVVWIGKRTISQALGKMTRSSGNYQHITEKLDNLAELGFVQIGETNRQGTCYTIALPRDVPSIRERLAMEEKTANAPLDYYRDPQLRLTILERDRWRCRYCGKRVDADSATLDHIVPRSKGGAGDAANLAACCLTCNSIKSGRTYEEAAPEILSRIAAGREASARSAI